MLFDDGIDCVELVMAVEDAFQITIPDRDAEELCTAGELTDYVIKAVNARHARPNDRCLSAAAFYATRRQLALSLAIDHRTLSPETGIDQFLPHRGRNERRAAWHNLGQALGACLPALELDRRLAAVPFCVAAVGTIAGAILKSVIPMVCGAIGFLLAVPVMVILEACLGTRVPQRCQTVGRLSALLMPKMLEREKRDPATWTDQEVWQIIRHLAAHCAAVPIERITRQTNFVRDLV